MHVQEQVTVVPKKGLRVLCSETGQAINEKGEVRSMSTYWARRARDGDVVITRKQSK